MDRPAPCFRLAPLAVALVALLAPAALAWPTQAQAAAVYRWVDEHGVTHLSSDRPPAGVPYERLDVRAAGPTGNKNSPRASSQGPTRLASVSPEQAARRNAAIRELQNRECVVALEAIDRVSRAGQPTDPAEFKRLQQTVDRNCSSDPATRREQEEMAAKLRVARGDTCVAARNELAEMLEPGRKPTREQLKAQQLFIETHCEAPVR